MAKHVTQKTFDDAVWENIKEFEMDVQEAIDDAVQQFTAQVRYDWLVIKYVERGSSAVECRTRNQVSPGSNPLCYRFDDWAFSFSPFTPQLTQPFKKRNETWL